MPTSIPGTGPKWSFSMLVLIFVLPAVAIVLLPGVQRVFGFFTAFLTSFSESEFFSSESDGFFGLVPEFFSSESDRFFGQESNDRFV